jgi:hypothetical protein
VSARLGTGGGGENGTGALSFRKSRMNPLFLFRRTFPVAVAVVGVGGNSSILLSMEATSEERPKRLGFACALVVRLRTCGS